MKTPNFRLSKYNDILSDDVLIHNTWYKFD